MGIRIRLREAREEHDPPLTQQELADRSGILRPHISRIESGSTEAVAFSVLERLAKALDVEPGDLIAWAGK